MDFKKSLSRAAHYIIHGIPIYNITADIKYTSPSQRLTGKRVLITGGGRGLGLAMAKKFKSEGADVLITGRNESVLENSAYEIQCKYIKFDVTEISDLHSLIEQSSLILGGLDVLVNNAGISLHEKSFFDVTPESFDSQFSTNLKAPFFLTQEFIKYLERKNEHGSVLFISSETGETADCRPYGFTKAAVNSMVKGLAYLFKRNGIRINAIAPGVTATDMTGVKSDGNLNAGNYGSGRFYLSEEIAEVAAFLVSDISGCISGQIITCNNANTINARWR